MTVKKFDQHKLQQCVDVLDAFARSGLSAQAFAQAQDLSYGQLRGWLALGASDLRAGMDTLLARAVQSMEGGARIHSAYVFANRGATRLKVLFYDGAAALTITPAQVIDKGIPAAGLLAQVIIAKFDDHLPLFRQEEIYRRSGAFSPWCKPWANICWPSACNWSRLT